MPPILCEAGGSPVQACGLLLALSRFAIELDRGDPPGTIAGISHARQAGAA